MAEPNPQPAQEEATPQPVKVKGGGRDGPDRCGDYHCRRHSRDHEDNGPTGIGKKKLISLQ